MPNEYSQEQIDLRDYLRVILKRRWTIMTVFAIILPAGPEPEGVARHARFHTRSPQE